MTRDEFEALMAADGWSDDQKRKWQNFTPVCDRSTFYRESAKPDGVIEVTKVHGHGAGVLQSWPWKRFFERAAYAEKQDRAPDGYNDRIGETCH